MAGICVIPFAGKARPAWRRPLRDLRDPARRDLRDPGPRPARRRLYSGGSARSLSLGRRGLRGGDLGGIYEIPPPGSA